MKRREFLKFMGILSGSAVVSSCRIDKNTNRLIPHLFPPPDHVIPGEPVFYRTTCTECPAGCGMEVKVYNGHPVKVEGITNHPLNNGALCLRGQVSLSRLYHPKRIKSPLKKDRNGHFKPVTWEEAISYIIVALKKAKNSGLKNYYLAGKTTGTLEQLISIFCKTMGIERLPEFEFFPMGTLRKSYEILFNRYEIPCYKIENSDCLITLGADIIETFLNPVYNAVQLTKAKLNNNLDWIHVEPHVSITGMNASKRVVINPGTEYFFLVAILQTILKKYTHQVKLPTVIKKIITRISKERILAETALDQGTIASIADKLINAQNPLIIIGNVSTGHESGLESAVLAGLIQWVTGSLGTVLDFSKAENFIHVGTLSDYMEFIARLKDEKPGVIFVSRADPLAFFHSFNFQRLDPLPGGSLKVAISGFMTKTAKKCDLVLPLSHSLESWGDLNPRKGLRSIIQPVTDPLFDTRSEGDILLDILNPRKEIPVMGSFQQYIFKEWLTHYGNKFPEQFINTGYYEEKTVPNVPGLNVKSVVEFFARIDPIKKISKPVLVVQPSIRHYDGRSRILPLTEEIPDPLTTISYGPWVSMPATTALKDNVKDNTVITITNSAQSINLPVKLQPGLPANVFTIHLDTVCPMNFVVNKKTGDPTLFLAGIKYRVHASKIKLPILSGSFSQHGRGIIPRPIHGRNNHDKHEGRLSLYPELEHPKYLWTMVIDLEKCNGCSACVAACYMENNVPAVGISEHFKGREMSWLRIEPYYEKGKVVFLPMMCQQCNYAPCEPVCPVYATYHNPEGLNAQIYNRCVGTRYCSNNCPYKVRRFNWFDHEYPGPLKYMRNPEISVRGRGVMEKCTFCIQRIRIARDKAKDENREIRENDIIPACAQTCPSNAIVFGNLLDKRSIVHKLANSKRAYRVFEHLGTDPSVYYLANINDTNHGQT